MIEAGPLRSRVRIQRAVKRRTSSGAFVEDYEPWITCWAAIEPLLPREFWAAQQVQSEITTRIRIRYRPGLNAKCRVLHARTGGSPTLVDRYDVEGPPIEDRANGQIQLMCVRRDAEGFRIGSDQPPPAPQTGFRVDTPDLRVDDPNWRVDSA